MRIPVRSAATITALGAATRRSSHHARTTSSKQHSSSSHSYRGTNTNKNTTMSEQDVLGESYYNPDEGYYFYNGEAIPSSPNEPIDHNHKDFTINEKTSIDSLYELGNSKNVEVRKTVASSERCPEDLLIKLAYDENEDVKKAAGFNPKFPLEKIFELSLMDECFVYALRHRVEKSTSSEELTEIYNFYRDHYRYISLRDFTRLSQIINDNKENALSGAVNYFNGKKTPISTWYIFEYFCKNPNCSLDILEELLHVADSTINEYAFVALEKRAKSEKTSVEDLRRMARIRSIMLQLTIASNPKCPDDVLLSFKNKPVGLLLPKNIKQKIREIEARRTNDKFKPVQKEEQIVETIEENKQEQVDEDNTELKL